MSDLSENYITITDEDGVEYELEILATLEYRDTLYYALAPATDDDDEGELEVSILKAVMEDGEEILVAIEDEAELEDVYAQLIDQLYEEDDEEDDEEEDE